MKNNEIKNNIINSVSSDRMQLSVVKSDSKFLVVEAPAGYGKTFTMISTISYWFACNLIPKHKLILCLSFSISAANRMKESISEKFVSKDSNHSAPLNIKTTNFHGFCRNILRKYGFLVGIDNIDDLMSVDPSKININHTKYPQELKIVQSIEKDIKSASLTIDTLDSQISNYIKAENKLLRYNKKISYDSIIISVLYLFDKYPSIKYGYQKYIKAICIDEFQDTNILGLFLVYSLICNTNRVLIFGDQMQQIFSFQGAIPNLIDRIISKNIVLKNDVDYIKLENNYRFANNKRMLALDKSIHEFRNDPLSSSITPVKVKNFHSIDIKQQALSISKLIDNLKHKDPNANFVILFNQALGTTKELLAYLSECTSFMNATFKANDSDFKEFEELVYNLYVKRFNNSCIGKNNIKQFCSYVQNCAKKSDLLPSFMELLEGFLLNAVSKIAPNYRSEYIIDILNSGSLRQSLPHIKNKVTASTIHGAKGLEWDYVILANFQQDEFPNYNDLKSMKMSHNEKIIDVNCVPTDALVDVVNKLYVAISRAKKEIFFTYCGKNFNDYLGKSFDTCLSSLSSLPFLDFD